MATRNIVPRADNEGGIGTALKRWATGFFAALTTTTINALTLTANAVGFSIAGGTTSKTLTVLDTLTLALGSANLKQFMNAAGTALEWASGQKAMTWTRDLSTGNNSVSYTGVGFKGNSMILFAGVDNVVSLSLGLVVGSTKYSFCTLLPDGKTVDLGTLLARFYPADIYNFVEASFVSWDDDGFTISYSKSNSPTGTAIFKAIIFR